MEWTRSGKYVEPVIVRAVRSRESARIWACRARQALRLRRSGQRMFSRQHPTPSIALAPAFRRSLAAARGPIHAEPCAPWVATLGMPKSDTAPKRKTDFTKKVRRTHQNTIICSRRQRIGRPNSRKNAKPNRKSKRSSGRDRENQCTFEVLPDAQVRYGPSLRISMQAS